VTDTRLAESFLTHPALDELSDGAHRVYVQGLVYAVGHGTDGLLPRRSLRFLHPEGPRPANVAELVAAGLWSAVGDGYEVRNFLRYQSSAEQVRLAAEARQAGRDAAAEKKREQRAGAKAKGATSVFRDVPGDSCRDSGRDFTGQAGQAGQALEATTRAVGTWPPTTRPGTGCFCVVCAQPMTRVEQGQTAHPGCAA